MKKNYHKNNFLELINSNILIVIFDDINNTRKQIKVHWKTQISTWRVNYLNY